MLQNCVSPRFRALNLSGPNSDISKGYKRKKDVFFQLSGVGKVAMGVSLIRMVSIVQANVRCFVGLARCVSGILTFPKYDMKLHRVCFFLDEQSVIQHTTTMNEESQQKTLHYFALRSPS